MKIMLLIMVVVFLLLISLNIVDADVQLFQSNFTVSGYSFFINQCTLNSSGLGGGVVCSTDQTFILNATAPSNSNGNFSFPNNTNEVWYMVMRLGITGESASQPHSPFMRDTTTSTADWMFDFDRDTVAGRIQIGAEGSSCGGLADLGFIVYGELPRLLNITYNVTSTVVNIWSHNTASGTLKLNATLTTNCAKTPRTWASTDTRDASGAGTVNVTYIEVWNVTETIVPDTTPPAVNITNFNATIKYGDRLNISCQSFGSATIGNITFNISGSKLYNFNFSLSGASSNYSQNITVNLTRGNVINTTCSATDGSNNLAQNSTLITVANTVPNGTNFINTTGLHRTTNLTINWTASTDGDTTDGTDTLSYVLYSDTSNPPTTLVANSTKNNFTTKWTSDNTYFFQIKVMDALSESALSSVFNLTLDTGLPTLTANCTNNTFTRFNLTCLFSIEDTFPYNLSVEVIRGSNSYYLRTNQTAIERFLNMTFRLNLTEDGNYTIYVNASDSDKTSPKIDDKLTKQKQSEEIHIYTDAEIKIRMELNLEFENSNGTALPLQSNLKSFSEFNSKGTHLEFGMNFTALNQSALPIFNVKTINVSLFYLNNTGKNNFVWKHYGIDFEGELKVNNKNESYGVNVRRVGTKNDNYQVILIPNETLNIGDNLTFVSSSVFGLNVIDLFYNIVNDQTSPSTNYFNVSGYVNNSFINKNFLNITINGSDILYPDIAQLYVNDKINASVRYVNDSRTNITNVNIGIDGNYTFRVKLNDSSGNELNYSYFYNIVIDTTAPTFINAFNRTADSSNSTSITTATDVNISIFGYGDVYSINGNFSYNISNGTWYNISSFDNGNGTYHLIISKNNLTAGMVGGWKFYGYDLAGNLLDPIYTYEVKSVPQPTTPKSSGGSSTGSVTIPQSLLNPFGTEPANGTCAIKEQLFDGKCYPCDPEIGYLEFNPNDRSVRCITCNEGFMLENKRCVLKPPITIKSRVNVLIDNLARRLSQYLNATILVGYIIISVSMILVAYYGYAWWKYGR